MHVFPRSFKREFMIAEYGEGIYIYDDKGNRYLDGCSGAVSANIGYGNKKVAEAVFEQLCKIPFAHGSIWETKINEVAAEKILKIAPKGFTHVWFVNAGSESTEAAIKMAHQYHLEKNNGVSEKCLVIGRENSYHGSTLGTLGVGGNVNRRRLFLPMIVDHPKIETHYCYRCPFNKKYPSCGLECAAKLEEKINRVGAKYVSAFIAEPVIGSTAGAVVAPDGYWQMVRDICDKHDVLLIADEVMTGCGRTGENFAVEHWQVVPDIIATAKGLAACYFPVGATLATEKVVEVFAGGSGVFAHSHTFNGMPAAAAAVSAVMDFYMENDLCGNSSRLGKLIEDRYAGPISECGIVGDFRGKGLMWGIEFVKDKDSKEPFARKEDIATRFKDFCLERGFTVYPGTGMVDGLNGDNVIIAPPLIINEEEIELLFSELIDALTSFSALVKK